MADLHHIAYCRGEDYVWGNDIDSTATECACTAYKNRNQGTDWWNTCPDCTYDGVYCNSKMKHIGGDEVSPFNAFFRSLIRATELTFRHR